MLFDNKSCAYTINVIYHLHPQDLSADLGAISLSESGIVVESDGVSGGAARGADALSVLDAPSTRAQFLQQLLEVCTYVMLDM